MPKIMLLHRQSTKLLLRLESEGGRVCLVLEACTGALMIRIVFWVNDLITV